LCVALLGCSGANPRPEGNFTLRQQPVSTCSNPLPAMATLWISDWLPDIRLDGIPGVDVLVTEQDQVGDASNVRFYVTLQMPHDGSSSVWATWKYQLWGDSEHLKGTAEYMPPSTQDLECPHTVESL
jgi:hypothetical protein